MAVNRIAVAILLLLPFAATESQAQVAFARGQNVAPAYEGWERNDDGSFSLVFGYIFHIAAILTALYAWRVRDTVQQTAATIYVGSAIGAVFAGDLLTLFVYWELTAISSVFLIWARRTERSYHAGMRYLIVQVGSGVLLLSGTILHYADTHSLAFDKLVDGRSLSSAGPGVVLIFLAFGIKCGFPLLHNWLTDAYPEATVTGTVFLSAFTTKLAVYALARSFPGAEPLIYIGVVMTAYFRKRRWL